MSKVKYNGNAGNGMSIAPIATSNKNEWVVICSDMDGLYGYQVVHSLDANQVRSGCYSGDLVKGLSLDKAKMQELAAKLNAKNEPAPHNPFRGMKF